MSSTLADHLTLLPAKVRSFAEGARLFRIDQKVRTVIRVESGVVHLTRYQREGSSLILQRAGSGDIVAEASLYSDRYHCEASAASDATVLEVPRNEVLARLATNPQFSALWASHLAHQLQRARLQTEIMSLKTVAARLNAWIAMRGSPPDRGEWARVAAEIGVSPEALYRELANRRRSL